MSSLALSGLNRATSVPLVWLQFPNVYEINTWIWLNDLSRKHQRALSLSTVPASEWDALAALGFDAVWLMGVWERSPAGVEIANQNQGLVESFRRALPDFTLNDNVGSPYCIRRYVADQNLGGPGGLAVARGELGKRGIKLILDFVPNHVAPDHPWATQHPEYFIQGTTGDLAGDDHSYVRVQSRIYACGRDPFFPAWPDVLQLNAFNFELRGAVRATIAEIAQQCDGIRCDMAMLLLNSVFSRTWAERAGAVPQSEYWSEVISSIKKDYPGFLFIAEAYWDLEWQLQQQGFDFCYDKKLYDRIENSSSENVRLHLCADFEYQRKLVRFIENHDEPRAASVFLPAKERAAAVLTTTLPGMKLLHEGQLEGRKVRPPVFLGRRPDESPDLELQAFYKLLLHAVQHDTFHSGKWTLNKTTGWPDNQTFQNLVAWNWEGAERYLVVVNLSDHYSQARVEVSWPELQEGTGCLTDLLSGKRYERNGSEMLSPGLYVELAPWGYHLLLWQQKKSS